MLVYTETENGCKIAIVFSYRNIRRMVFHTLEKFDGALGEMQPLSSSHVKQIAGRAGRYGKDHAHGEVTT